VAEGGDYPFVLLKRMRGRISGVVCMNGVMNPLEYDQFVSAPTDQDLCEISRGA
jgi:hypothetical protein